MKAITIIRHDDGSLSVVGLDGDDDDIALIHEGLDAIARGRRLVTRPDMKGDHASNREDWDEPTS